MYAPAAAPAGALRVTRQEAKRCHASRRPRSHAAPCAAPRRSRSPAARRSTAATAGTRRSPSRRSSRASSRSSATSARTAPRSTSIYHSTIKRPCGQLLVVDDGYDLFLSLILLPNFSWDDAAYHLDGRSRRPQLLGDPRRRRRDGSHRAMGRRQVAPRDLPRGRRAEPEDWNGEM